MNVAHLQQALSSSINAPPPPTVAADHDYRYVDLSVATLITFHLLFSLAAAASVLYFQLFASRRRRRLLGLSSLWPVRLLLVLFASLWSSAELLRLPAVVLHLPHPSSLALSCRAYSLLSHSLAEPAFFATLLFLLRASTQQCHFYKDHSSSSKSSPNPPSSFAAALISAVAAAIPFLAIALLSPWALRHSHIPEDLLGPDAYAVLFNGDGDGDGKHCAYPLFGTVLLAALSSVYVPLFVSACWGAVTVVINKRLRVRLYALAAAVVVALSVQVSALALSALLSPGGAAAQGLALAAFLAVLTCVVAGEAILVVHPIIDALAVVDPGTSGSGSGCGDDYGDTCAPRDRR